MNEEEFQNLKNEMAALQRQLHQSQEKLMQLEEKINSAVNFKAVNEILPAQHQSNKQNEFPRQHTLENFIGLKIIHLVGIVVLLIGISIGVKYAIDKNLITPVTRILLAYAAGIALFLLSI